MSDNEQTPTLVANGAPQQNSPAQPPEGEGAQGDGAQGQPGAPGQGRRRRRRRGRRGRQGAAGGTQLVGTGGQPGAPQALASGSGAVEYAPPLPFLGNPMPSSPQKDWHRDCSGSTCQWL
jgi:hypothetical protein